MVFPTPLYALPFNLPANFLFVADLRCQAFRLKRYTSSLGIAPPVSKPGTSFFTAGMAAAPNGLNSGQISLPQQPYHSTKRDLEGLASPARQAPVQGSKIADTPGRVRISD